MIRNKLPDLKPIIEKTLEAHQYECTNHIIGYIDDEIRKILEEHCEKCFQNGYEKGRKSMRNLK